ncbi:hypothetical protein FQN54_004132 [Arachnomyces sp. PD_36]|nr:hypothetical protein FQN54_004132 [Arachnomyces sp. PD_36]
MPGRTRPIEKFAQATAKCSLEAATYGKCIVADYNAGHKDMCVKEFMRLKDCYLVNLTPGDVREKEALTFQYRQRRRRPRERHGEAAVEPWIMTVAAERDEEEDLGVNGISRIIVVSRILEEGE